MSERLRVRFTACSPFSSSPFSLFLCFLLALPPSFLLFLTRSLPLPLCPHMYTGAMGGADGGMGGGGASGAGGGGYGYYGNVPASMYGLLLGAPRLPHSEGDKHVQDQRGAAAEGVHLLAGTRAPEPCQLPQTPGPVHHLCHSVCIL